MEETIHFQIVINSIGELTVRLRRKIGELTVRLRRKIGKLVVRLRRKIGELVVHVRPPGGTTGFRGHAMCIGD